MHKVIMAWCSHESHCPRKATKDVATFDYILCMDESDLRYLTRRSNQAKNSKAILELLGICDPQKQLLIEDPYNENDSNFETIYQ